MKIFKRIFLIFISSFSFISPVFSQTVFEGFYGQVLTGYEKNTVGHSSPTVTGNGINYSGTSTGDGISNSAPLVFGAGYTFNINTQFNIGLGFDFYALQQNTGDVYSNFGSQGGGIGNTSYHYRISNRYNIFLMPGINIGKDKVAYFKGGYSNETISALGNIDTNNQHVDGYVIGLGYKQIITDGLYGLIEANYFNYGKGTLSAPVSNGSASYYPNMGTPSAFNILIGLGYKF